MCAVPRVYAFLLGFSRCSNDEMRLIRWNLSKHRIHVFVEQAECECKHVCELCYTCKYLIAVILNGHAFDVFFMYNSVWILQF